MMKFRLTITMLLLAGFCGAPVALKAQVMEQAEKHFNNNEYAQALEVYQSAFRNGKSSLAVAQRIAESYRMLNNSQEAEQWYAKVVEYTNAAPINTYYYAMAAKQNGDYEKAKKLFQEYAQQAPEQSALAMEMAASTDTAAAWIKTPRSFEVKKVESLNSSAADFSPVKGENGLFFTSNRPTAASAQQNAEGDLPGNNYMKVYYAEAKSDSTWATPVALGEVINGAYHNGPAAFSEANQTLYFTRSQVNKRVTRTAISDPTSWLRDKIAQQSHTNYHGIYMAERKDGSWVNVKPFKFNNTKEYSVGHPAITADGKILYFVSDMPGGFGETDIYYAERQADGSWGAPVNAGSVINTTGRESFPTIGADGNLYFSSNTHVGMGGLDIFKAIGSHKDWARVENMRAPINSSNDDFGLWIDETGKSGMFSSGRTAQGGADNIYSFTYKEIKPVLLEGQVLAQANPADSLSKSGSPIDSALLQVSEIGKSKIVESYSDENGDFAVELMPGKNYTIRASKEDYLAQSKSVEVDPEHLPASEKLEFVLEPKRENVPVKLNNIYYDLNSAELQPIAKEELDKLVKMLKDNPEVKIEIGSHTDSRGHRKYNRELSERRANSVVEYLISKGIERNRLTAKGYGEYLLINECNDFKRMSCSEEMHQQNRRTEFKIIK